MKQKRNLGDDNLLKGLWLMVLIKQLFMAPSFIICVSSFLHVSTIAMYSLIFLSFLFLMENGALFRSLGANVSVSKIC